MIDKKNTKIGQRVRISGGVKYGDKYYRVASYGTIQDIGKVKSLVTVDMIDGDKNVCTFVDNSVIYNN
jgi:hypothetical protein